MNIGSARCLATPPPHPPHKTTRNLKRSVDLAFRIRFQTSSPFYLSSLVISYLCENTLSNFYHVPSIYMVVKDHTLVIKYIIFDFIYK